MPHKKNNKSHWYLDPQTAPAAQLLTDIVSTGAEVYFGRTRFDYPCDILPFQAK